MLSCRAFKDDLALDGVQYDVKGSSESAAIEDCFPPSGEDSFGRNLQGSWFLAGVHIDITETLDSSSVECMPSLTLATAFWTSLQNMEQTDKYCHIWYITVPQQLFRTAQYTHNYINIMHSIRFTIKALATKLETSVYILA